MMELLENVTDIGNKVKAIRVCSVVGNFGKESIWDFVA
jgi:hypothetical protein